MLRISSPVCRVKKERGFLWHLMEQFLAALDSVPAEGEELTVLCSEGSHQQTTPPHHLQVPWTRTPSATASVSWSW